MHQLVSKIAEQKLLVTFKTYTRREVKKVFLICYGATLINTSNVEFLRKVQSENSIIIYLTKDRHVCQILYFLTKGKSWTSNWIEINFFYLIAFTFLKRFR
jgi:hypothetical protein